MPRKNNKLYTSQDIGNIIGIKSTHVGYLLKKYKFTPTLEKYNVKLYNESALIFLKELFNFRIEIVEVPVNVPVYYEILQSKMNVM